MSPQVPGGDWHDGAQSARALFGVNARPAAATNGYGMYGASASPGYLPRLGWGYSGAPCRYAGSYGYPQHYGSYGGYNGGSYGDYYGGYNGGYAAARQGYRYSYYGLSGPVACGAYGTYQPAGYYYAPPPITPLPPPPIAAAAPTSSVPPTAAPQPAASEGVPAAVPATPQAPAAPALELAVCYGRVYDGCAQRAHVRRSLWVNESSYSLGVLTCCIPGARLPQKACSLSGLHLADFVHLASSQLPGQVLGILRHRYIQHGAVC